MEHVDPSVVVVKPARTWSEPIAFAAMVAILVVAPVFAYPVFLMKALCFALFACAFNLLIGYVGLLSFGHAVFLGSAGYGRRTPRKSGGSRRSWRSSSGPRSRPHSAS